MSEPRVPRAAPTRPERGGKLPIPRLGRPQPTGERSVTAPSRHSRRRLARVERERRMRRGIYLGAAILAAIIVLVLGFGYLRETVLRAQDTAAVIFGERITTGELAELVRPRLAAVDRQIALMRANNMAQQAASLQFQRNSLPESILNDLVDDRVIRREAAARAISVAPAEVDEELRQRIAKADLVNQPQPTTTPAPTFPPGTTATPVPTPVGTPTPRPTPTPVATLTEDRFPPARQEYLLQSGQSEQQLRQSIESDLYEQKLREAIGQAEVPAVQEQVHARHIVFKTEDEAKVGAEQLQSGASTFEALAAAQSTDTATKEKGGDLGWLPRLGRDPAFDEAAFALQPGQTSPVVQSSAGWELIQVTERDPRREVPPAQLDELRRRAFGDWLSAAVGNPEISRELSPDESAWVIQRAGGRGS